MVIETSTNNGNSWTTRLNDSSSKVVYTCTFDTGGTATNAIRFTFTDSSLSSQIRIQSMVPITIILLEWKITFYLLMVVQYMV